MPFQTRKGKNRIVLMTYRCLLFDLDGTLVDSRADLIYSVNLMLAELGRRPLADQSVLSFVGEGARLLVERALRAADGREAGEPEIEIALGVFRRHYRAHLFDQTRPYPEVEETLERLAGLPKAVVTNKPFDFSVALLDGLGMSKYFIAVIGGDSLSERKPAPAPLLEAARLCGHRPEDCLMIGDTRIDIEAGQAAGMKTCGYVGGFRGAEELERAGADFLIERFGELPGILSRPSPVETAQCDLGTDTASGATVESEKIF
jgi:phosphoglycolate phosphatase